MLQTVSVAYCGAVTADAVLLTLVRCLVHQQMHWLLGGVAASAVQWLHVENDPYVACWEVAVHDQVGS